MSKKKPAVEFSRVSSKDQRDGFSLEAQGNMAVTYAKKNNLVIVKNWSVDESASKEGERKHFFAMIEFVKENAVKDVIFDKVDRACRGLHSALKIEELIDKYGVRFHFSRDNLVIDSSSPSSEKLRFYLNVILAKYYIDNLRTEIKKGSSQREEQGLWNYKAPLGYLNKRRPEDRKAVVVVDKETSPYIKEAFQMYSTGNYSLREIGKFLNANITHRKISKTLVETMLVNPFYCGSMRVKGRVIPGKHEPLISKKLFELCQRVHARRGEGYQPNASLIVKKPFMGMFRCGACGWAVTGEVKKKASGKVYVYYHCANRDCAQRRKNTAQGKIEEQLIAAFEPFSRLTEKATKAFIEGIRGAMDDLDLYTRTHVGELAEKRLRAKRNIAEVERLRDKVLLSEDDFQILLEAKKEALEQTDSEISAHLAVDRATLESGLNVIELLRKSHDFMRMPENTLEKARLVKLVVSNPVLKDGRVEFNYQKPFDHLVVLTGKKIWWSHQGLLRAIPWPFAASQGGRASSAPHSTVSHLRNARRTPLR